MFVVMNRFSINPGRESDFEDSWRNRESYLHSVAGFRGFALLRNQSNEGGHTEFISYTTWETRADFDAWRQSDDFRRAHAQGSLEGVLTGPPKASLYETIVEEAPATTAPHARSTFSKALRRPSNDQ